MMTDEMMQTVCRSWSSWPITRKIRKIGPKICLP